MLPDMKNVKVFKNLGEVLGRVRSAAQRTNTTIKERLGLNEAVPDFLISDNPPPPPYPPISSSAEQIDEAIEVLRDFSPSAPPPSISSSAEQVAENAEAVDEAIEVLRDFSPSAPPPSISSSAEQVDEAIEALEGFSPSPPPSISSSAEQVDEAIEALEGFSPSPPPSISSSAEQVAENAEAVDEVLEDLPPPYPPISSSAEQIDEAIEVLRDFSPSAPSLSIFSRAEHVAGTDEVLGGFSPSAPPIEDMLTKGSETAMDADLDTPEGMKNTIIALQQQHVMLCNAVSSLWQSYQELLEHSVTRSDRGASNLSAKGSDGLPLVPPSYEETMASDEKTMASDEKKDMSSKDDKRSLSQHPAEAMTADRERGLPSSNIDEIGSVSQVAGHDEVVQSQREQLNKWSR